MKIERPTFTVYSITYIEDESGKVHEQRHADPPPFFEYDQAVKHARILLRRGHHTVKVSDELICKTSKP